jgi:hypothetical protein
MRGAPAVTSLLPLFQEMPRAKLITTRVAGDTTPDAIPGALTALAMGRLSGRFGLVRAIHPTGHSASSEVKDEENPLARIGLLR